MVMQHSIEGSRVPKQSAGQLVDEFDPVTCRRSLYESLGESTNSRVDSEIFREPRIDYGGKFQFVSLRLNA